MNAKDAIRQTINTSDMVVNKYLADLGDKDLFLRPVEGMNHIAWQLGHLISAEKTFAESIKPGCSPPLPEGFAEAHSKDTRGSDDHSKFRTKDDYLSLWKSQREATFALLDSLDEHQLDAPSPERFRSFMPTVGALMGLVGTHPLMHVGQWVTVRRMLKKPVVI
jgi:hypothetical protein